MVLGKGGKLGTVPIPNAVMNALGAYGEIIEQNADFGALPEGLSFFQTLDDGSWRVKKSEDYARQPMFESQVYRMFKGHFKITASRMETALNAGHLNQASRYWLRHTHASRKSRKSAVEKLMAFAELS